jgi:hypothetical protein
MKLQSIAFFAQLAVAAALPSELESRVYVPCTDLLYGTAYCCTDDILEGYIEYVPLHFAKP